MAEKERRVVMVAQHSPRVRARQTAEAFMKGAKAAAREAGINLSTERKTWKPEVTGLRKVQAFEALTASSEAAGKAATPSDKLEEELANVNEGKHSDHLLSKDEMLAENRMGLLLSRDQVLGKVARFLTNKLPAAQRKHAPAVISIYLRHSRNRGDQLTEDGVKLAEAQGKKLMGHLAKYVLGGKFGTEFGEHPLTPAVVLTVSHGGGKTPGQLDWVMEKILKAKMAELGGPVSHAEGLVSIAYGSGKVDYLVLRQRGIMHLHGE